jgi:hypothetical protein
MSSIFAVLINNVPELEFDRTKSLSERQQHFLEVMDNELSGQIVIGEQVINNPDLHQRAQFVAINLINALKSGDDGLAAAMCSYLALRVPDLKKVQVEDKGEQVVIDLVFDEDYVKQVNVEFTGRQTTKH